LNSTLDVFSLVVRYKLISSVEQGKIRNWEERKDSRDKFPFSAREKGGGRGEETSKFDFRKFPKLKKCSCLFFPLTKTWS